MLAVSLGSAVAPYITDQGASVLVADEERVSLITKAIFEDGNLTDPALVGVQVTPSPVRIEIQNGAGVDGLAADVMLHLIGKDLREDDLTASNTSDGLSRELSEIIDIDGTHENNTNLLSRWLGIPFESIRTATADERAAMQASNTAIVVVLGADFDSALLNQAATDETGVGG
jgi:hypothetical protein